MSDKPKVPYDKAVAVAKELRAILSPFCEQCKIVGSLRRGRKFVGDIELLFIPKLAPDPSTFFGALMGTASADMIDMAETTINRLVKDGVLAKRPNVNGSLCWGKQNKLAVHTASGIPVDFFATTQANWFVSLVIRTGGKRTNLALTMGANRRGLTLHAYGSGFGRLSDGEHIPARSEQEVFQIAGVPFVEPALRL
jgi:DNA polymerase/3'-5' exonuclease PolX